MIIPQQTIQSGIGDVEIKLLKIMESAPTTIYASTARCSLLAPCLKHAKSGEELC
ncbi:MAG: hypothetical protein ACTS73_03320 [Arsenophonus sp. NEOnobi-MAG3]